MKKLLAAVTSFAMSVSLMSSAFASPFNVSAAGSISAEQPNVSMGEVLDGAVNKTAVQADFVVTPNEIKAKPGETVEVEVYASAGSHKVGQYVVRLDESDLPQGIKYSVEDRLCYAVDAKGNFEYELLGDTYYCSTLSSGDPTPVKEDEPVIIFNFTIPATAEPGEYDWNISRFHVVEDGINKIEFDANVKPGKIVIEGDGVSTSNTTAPTTTKNQPNTTTTKAPNPNAKSDFIVTPKTVTAKPGEEVEVEVGVKAGNHKVGQYIVRLDESDLPQGITYTVDDPLCYAVGAKGNYEYELLGDTYYCSTLSGGDPTPVNEDEPVIIYNFKIPANAKPGTYNWNISRFHVVEDGINKLEFDATIEPGTIIITGDGEQTTTSTTTTVQPGKVASDFIVTPQDITAKPGDKVDVEVSVKAGSHKVSQYIVRLDESDLPQGITYSLDDELCYAVDDNGTHKFEKIKDTYYCTTLNAGDPTAVKESEPVMVLSFKIPETAKPGKYDWKLSRFHVVEDGYNKIEFDATINAANITILGDDTTTTTTATTSTTTTTKTTVTTTTTTGSTETTTVTTANDGKAVWAIPNVKAKAGSTVKMDVIVDGQSDLAVAGAQFDINAKAPIALSAAGADCAAYSSKLVANAGTSEFAFGENKGDAHIAANGAVIATLTFEVPANASGVYPVEWANVFVSDTNGNEITKQVTLKNGSITVESDTTDGSVTWEIPTVHAKAGSTAKMEIAVSGTKGDVSVGGAQFVVSSDKFALASVGKQSAAYNGDVTSNTATNEIAFANANGDGTVAADGEIVAVVNFDIPAGTPAGEYDVVWGKNAFISDANGNDITSNVTLVNGKIIIDDVTDGDITWTIDEKHAKPGETVELEAKVTVGTANLSVGGAQFDLPVSDPITLSTAAGSDGYSAALTFNVDTNEFAFANKDGAGVEAKDGSAVIKLTYKVAENAKPGKYPVEWTDAFVSDSNGEDITAKISFINGAIIVDEDTTTSTSTTTTDSTDTTTKTTVSTDTDTTSTSTSTTTDTTTTYPVSESTTSVISLPDGAVAWDIQEVDAQPGETVAVPVIVLDPNKVNLPIGGAQFKVTADTVTYDSIAAGEYGAKVVANPSTFEFAFADENGGEMTAANGAKVFTISYVVPEGTPEGQYPVVWNNDFFNVSSADGADMTDRVVCVNGAINVVNPKTTTSSATTTKDTTTSTVSTDTDTTTKTTDTTVSSSTSTSTSTSTTTTVSVPRGAIGWQVESVTAQVGDEVTLKITVVDPSGSALPVGGAQFVMTNEGDIAIVGGTGSDAYSAKIVNGVDGDVNRFAFAHEIGEGVVAGNGDTVITLTYKVSENAKPGTYPVNITELNVSDTNGNDITKQILPIAGSITIVEPVVTSSTTSTVTTSSTTTVSTSETSTQSTDSTSKSTDTTTKTTASTTQTTATETTGTTTTVSVPKGVVGWQLNNVKGKAGEKVTLTMTVLDPAKNGLMISGGQFVLSTDPVIDSASGTPYGAKLEYNPATSEFAFADKDGNGIAAVNGATMMTIEYIIPADAKPGTIYHVDFDKLFVSDENGNDITANILGIGGSIEVLPEEISTSTTNTTEESTTKSTETTASTSESTTKSTETTASTSESTTKSTETTASTSESTTKSTETTASTSESTTKSTETSTSTTDTTSPSTESSTSTSTSTTTPGVTTSVYAEGTPVNGYYFSHDPRNFKKGHLDGVKFYSVDEKGSVTPIDATEFLSKVTFKDVKKGASTPEDAYDVNNTTFAYEVAVYYNDAPLKDATGKALTFTVYIGVKGDSNLDNKVDSSDATNVLAYYSELATKPKEISADTIRITPDTNKFVNENPELDQLCAFLADVDRDVYDEANWKTRKADTANRKIDSSDASWILAFYSIKSTASADTKDHTIWNMVLADQHRGEHFEEYVNAE